MSDPLEVSCEEWREMAEENLEAMEVITAALVEVGEETCFSEADDEI